MTAPVLLEIEEEGRVVEVSFVLPRLRKFLQPVAHICNNIYILCYRLEKCMTFNNDDF